MKGKIKGSNIISIVHNLKIATEFMDDFIRERPNAVLTRIFKDHKKKINWMLMDIKSDPLLPQIVRDGINQELNSDVLSVPAINEKVLVPLPPNKREMVELVIDQLLNGESIEVELK